VDRADLAARIQEILKNRRASTPAGAPVPAAPRTAEASSRVLDVLGATLLDGANGPCVVVDRHYPSTGKHGHHRLARYLSPARSSIRALPWFLDRYSPAESRRPLGDTAPRLACFDLETTGLSGGAGTYAFLVGFGYFDADGFRTRQFFLRRFGEERALLRAVAQEVAAGDPGSDLVLVTYNGRAFDVPLIDTRYQMHRLEPPFGRLPHVDMLFPARRLWKGRPPATAGRQPSAVGRDDGSSGSCSLTAIERDILGLHRQDDVPGWEIPSRYFGYMRSGDASGLSGVLEHNRLDLVSLGAVAAVVLEMAAGGVSSARERHDYLALGRLFESLGRLDEAERCYQTAAVADGTAERDHDREVRADALHWLARRRRHARRFDQAAEAWLELTRIPGIDSSLRRAALEALAIHHEHRAKDLEQAREFALSALQLSGDARHVDEVRHRLGRLSRKLGPK
jgi:uncharacterized protein YprB with RNaseH-like and TPR domain